MAVRVVVAPDKFKGSLSAAAVADAVARGIRTAAPDVEVVPFPIADGGDGTVEFMLEHGYTAVKCAATGPGGRPVTAQYAIRGRTSVIEMALVSGLSVLEPPGANARTALDATTFGVGQLIRHALDRGARRIVVGLGGSATTDGGAGALVALGARLVGAHGEPVAPGGRALAEARELVLSGLDPRLAEVELLLACDVDNPLYGPDGAAAVYAPQKGATPHAVALLDSSLRSWAGLVAEATGIDLSGSPGSGAAGGLAFGLCAVAGGQLVPGAAMLLDLAGFERVVGGAALVVVGEGSLDAQSLRGKGPVRVAAAARSAGVPVVAVVGRNLISSEAAAAVGITQVYAMTDIEPDESRSMSNAPQLLEKAGESIAADHLAGAPARPRGLDKVVGSAADAVADIPAGATVAVGGFGLCGIPSVLIDALLAAGATDLEIVSNNCGVDDWGLGRLLNARRIRRMVSSYVGENKEFARQYLSGELEVELTPQGTLAERMRAGGCGIPAFFTPAGVGTQIAEGGLPWRYSPTGEVVVASPRKETRQFHGRDFVMEEAIVADFALVRAWKGDRHGNLVFRQSSRNFNPLAAMCGRITIAEVEHLVEPGELDADLVHTPGVFVQRVVALGHDQAAEKRIERRTVRPRTAATTSEGA